MLYKGMIKMYNAEVLSKFPVSRQIHSPVALSGIASKTHYQFIKLVQVTVEQVILIPNRSCSISHLGLCSVGTKIQTPVK